MMLSMVTFWTKVRVFLAPLGGLLMILTSPAYAQVSVAPTSRFVAVERLPVVFQVGCTTSCELEALQPGLNWDEAIVSWNVRPAAGARLKVEARVVYPDTTTKWYVMADWSLDGPRTSVDGQRDDYGDVLTDTLSVRRAGGALQLRLTGTCKDPGPQLTLLGVEFSTKPPSVQAAEPLKPGEAVSAVPQAAPPSTPATAAGARAPEPNRAAWGKVLEAPKKVQHDYPHGNVLCSPTSLSMVLGYWSGQLARPDLSHDVPEVEASVWDVAYKGAGNWPFNMASAGSHPGIRAYVARLASVRELEDWVVAGGPVVASVSLQLLKGKTLDRKTEQGHLVVLVGFSKEGDPVFNDPNEHDRLSTYKRADFEAAWAYSQRTVYLVYPESFVPPKCPEGHWLPGAQ
ncbi:MAG: C39 family peptidase [Fimbriimonas ginsengisoli]|uniref:C39 family peptidase n=1 Tax=Fimbriimonas ginsengisoli TaxID=1005039 RepID=A0A931LZK8_FIMGI|nr:C39 family peptidase [Fimbriimonas ginsengisoli]